ncbi:predicted protein [Nematostella vectensis]|uniref:Uncharacterized protein n=1 Tax=Nematostella vectensis TaxID=45351 RepID=A7RFU4_NEMVE|nr:predicted protein [Nematostella vectensis]|eukprot:XP_001641842.1 predicted protein [Nematostella vectensis]
MQPRKKKPRLSILQRVFFSLGHIFNDFVLAIYSSYLLIYQTKVLGLSSVVVGLVWLIPNAVDAFLALLVGYICDNFVVPGLSKCYGRRKSWHLLGCILLGISFPFLLMPCLFNTSSGYWVEAVYYIIITEISYLGYCFTHANQLAMIPDIAKRPSEMVELGAISSSVTFASGIFVYAIVWALLDGDSTSRVTPLSTPRLSRHTRAHNLPLGSNFSLSRRASHGPSPLASTVLSLPGTQDYLTKKLTDIREVVNVLKAETNASDFVIIERSRPIERDGGSWRRLFTNPMFYKIGFAYMCTRMAQNVTNAYFPIFLTDHLKFGKQAIAYFPLVTLISGVFASVATKTLNRILGNKWTFCVGALVVMGSSLWFYSLTKETRSATYAPAIMSGCGTSIMFVTTLALAAELVDQDRSSGAFVMASMSFLSKIVLGTLFFFLQELTPKSSG